MAEELKKNGIFLDENYILRVLEPSVLKDTHDLKEENEVFQDSKFFNYKFIKINLKI